jgi:integrase
MQALTEDELLRFLQACWDASKTDWMMAVLAVNHGLRVGELTGRWAVKRVKGQKIRYFHKGILASEVKDGFVTVRRLKGSNRTTQELVSHENPLLNEREAIERLALIKPAYAQLFKMDRSTAWRHFQRHGRKAGIRLSSAHIRGLKHTLGTLAAEKVPVKVLQMQMGHKDPKSAMAYYDVTAQQASARIAAVLGGHLR